ncbi:MAG: hypothetical protein RLY71_645 [Pseudomonadota bacterium]|jgi:hypothetical protein
MKPLHALALMVAVGCCACTPARVRQRINFHVRADGSCLMDARLVGCGEAAPQAAAKYMADGVNAGLFINAGAPHASALAMRAGMLDAHISHVQFGDSAHQQYMDAEAGLD